MNSLSTHIDLNEIPTHGRVLVIEPAGPFECRWGRTLGMVCNSIRRHRPDYLVIDVRELRGIRACLSVFMELPVGAASEMHRLSAERQTALIATGENATALNIVIPMMKLEDLLGKTVFLDMESALAAQKRRQRSTGNLT